MAMGSNPARIDNGRINNAFKFRDRVIRTKRFKAFIDTTANVNALFDLEADPWEEENILRTSSGEAEQALELFRRVISQMPDTDGRPVYDKLDTSFYDIPVEILNRSSDNGKLNPNRKY